MKKIYGSFILAALLLCASGALAVQAPQPGAQAPVFTLPSQTGRDVSLDHFHGKWVVLYFYPKDFTGGCTLEAHNFQMAQEKFAARNAVVIGVSVDGVDSHKSFCAREGLNFRLLSDASGNVTAMYGSTMEKDGKTLAARNTFVLDPEGVIRKTYLHVDPSGHSTQLLADLDTLQAGEKK